MKRSIIYSGVVLRLVPFLILSAILFNDCKNGTQRLYGIQFIMKRSPGPITSINKFIYNFSDSSFGRAGKTGGAFGFALIFLFLFPSREKEKKECLLNVGIALKFFLSFACPKERNKEKGGQIRLRRTAAFGRPAHINIFFTLRLSFLSN